jgi:hypothetical protein
MKPTTSALLLCAAALALPACKTTETPAAPPVKPAVTQPASPKPNGKQHPKWVKVAENTPEPKVPGKYKFTDDGMVVTLANGHKYITKNGEGGVQLILPNGQVFTSESAKSDSNPAFVNEDETFLAATRNPATQTGHIHLYYRASNGKYREVPNEDNSAINALLDTTYEGAGSDIMSVRAIHGRTVTLWSLDRRAHSDYLRFEFKLNVSTDGKLSLVK